MTGGGDLLLSLDIIIITIIIIIINQSACYLHRKLAEPAIHVIMLPIMIIITTSESTKKQALRQAAFSRV